jgi:hypothetical protein
MIDRVTDNDPTPEQLEQLARSIAMSGNLGDRDRREVIGALRQVRRERNEPDVAGIGAKLEQYERGARIGIPPVCERARR